jgi:hypothetical protein
VLPKNKENTFFSQKLRDFFSKIILSCDQAIGTGNFLFLFSLHRLTGKTKARKKLQGGRVW